MALIDLLASTTLKSSALQNFADVVTSPSIQPTQGINTSQLDNTNNIINDIGSNFTQIYTAENSYLNSVGQAAVVNSNLEVNGFNSNLDATNLTQYTNNIGEAAPLPNNVSGFVNEGFVSGLDLTAPNYNLFDVGSGFYQYFYPFGSDNHRYIYNVGQAAPSDDSSYFIDDEEFEGSNYDTTFGNTFDAGSGFSQTYLPDNTFSNEIGETFSSEENSYLYNSLYYEDNSNLSYVTISDGPGYLPQNVLTQPTSAGGLFYQFLSNLWPEDIEEYTDNLGQASPNPNNISGLVNESINNSDLSLGNYSLYANNTGQSAPPNENSVFILSDGNSLLNSNYDISSNTTSYTNNVGEAGAPNENSILYNNGFSGNQGFDLENNGPISDLGSGFIQTYVPNNTFVNDVGEGAVEGGNLYNNGFNGDQGLDLNNNGPINVPGNGFVQTYLPDNTFSNVVGEGAVEGGNLYNNGYTGNQGLDLIDNGPINTPEYGFTQTYLPDSTFVNAIGSQAAPPDDTSLLYLTGFNGLLDIQNNPPTNDIASGFKHFFTPNNPYLNNIPG